MPHEIFSDNSHAEVISQLRGEVGPTVSSVLTDHDCLRFLRARQGDVRQAAGMLQRWYEWRHTLLDPLPPSNHRFTPNIILLTPDKIDIHPQAHLIECAHHGFGRNGEPIYWEKTGKVQSQFKEVRKYFSNIQLLQYHIMSNEVMDARLEYASQKFNRHVHKSIVVFDMKHVTITLDMDSIWYIKQLLEVDQNYYPERLYKLFIINCPWYFPALYGIFKPFIDERTRNKITVCGGDFLPLMEEVVEVSNIPVEYGGQCEHMPWDMKFVEESGASLSQVDAHMRSRLKALQHHFTTEEVVILLEALDTANMHDDIDQLEREMLEGCDLGDATRGTVCASDITPATTCTTPAGDVIGGDEVCGRNTEVDRRNIRTGRGLSHRTVRLAAMVQVFADFRAKQQAQQLDNSMRESQLLAAAVTDDGGQPGEVETAVDDAAGLSYSGLESFMSRHVRVRDVLSVDVVDVERTGGHHDYVINVNCRRNLPWTVKRRYSQFHKFRKVLKRIEPDMTSIAFPPKVYFNKTSNKVARARRSCLGDFLREVISRTEDFDTPQQDMLFRYPATRCVQFVRVLYDWCGDDAGDEKWRFLDAYDHINNDIYDDLSVGTWGEVRDSDVMVPMIPSLNATTPAAPLQYPSSATPARQSTRFNEMLNGPLAAAVVSVCVIVLSLFGHALQVQRITSGDM